MRDYLQNVRTHLGELRSIATKSRVSAGRVKESIKSGMEQSLDLVERLLVDGERHEEQRVREEDNAAAEKGEKQLQREQRNERKKAEKQKKVDETECKSTDKNITRLLNTLFFKAPDKLSWMKM